jgi:transcription-repair coupling factor (superfamily II helicase)
MLEHIQSHLHIDEVIKPHKKTVYFKSSTDAYNAYLLATDFQKNRKTVFVVVANLYEAQKYYDMLTQITDSEDVLFYPVDQTLTAMMALGSPEFRSERLYTIRKLLSGNPYIVVMTYQGLTYRQLLPDDYLSGVKKLSTKEHYDVDALVAYLINSGYKRSYIVERPGEFSLRGGILDVYTLDHEHPFRLDFFDDELELIKRFSVENQKSFETIESVELTPMYELFYTQHMRDRAVFHIQEHFKDQVLSEKEKQKLDKDIESIKQRQNLEGLMLYISFFNQKETSILDFSTEYTLYMIDTHKMFMQYNQTKDDLNTYATTMNGKAFLSIPFAIDFIRQHQIKHIEISNLGIETNETAISLGVTEVSRYQGNLGMLAFDLKMMMETHRIYICIDSDEAIKQIKTFLDEQNLPYRLTFDDHMGIHLTRYAMAGSFYDTRQKIIYFGIEDIFNKRIKKAIRYRSVINQATKIRNIDDLSVGDFVVHYDYGIGQYMGLKTMDLSGQKKDYLYIIYANEEALYVPMDQIDLVLKYSNYEGMHPKLSKLGGKQWAKTKASVKMRIKDLSDRLIKLYAQRQQSLGHAFAKDDLLQQQFEADFIYNTTPDQEKAIIATKFDMEQEKPMDRLICGDVGFGKTEVALRASFKAVLSAKQVLYLVPTTVLARQHYYLFKERFEKYGGNVALLSRFVKPKKQKQIIDRVKKGYIDVLIGTHRVLSKDIGFKDLGLLIIDEEQRFGVEHKERIKEIKINVDTLTLSATPIPRTLQMAMMGLKDLSMIETPPLNRYPVQTYVVEYQEALIKEAISREVARGGQVFYLFNYVTGIEGMVKRLKDLVPEARIAYAHGKMHRDQLEDVLSSFIEHEYDVLVSTTIIETGVDIPNTNTLIIHDADKLGLSQLYQIRGRVGRSDKIAYAYLLYDSRKYINEEAQKRLAAIEDFTALGSGYKIAMRDLSIRGAGDVLGQEQSGFIDSVGIELYMKLLEEAITGEPIEKPKETSIDEVYAARHVDPNYVETDAARIEIHKKIAAMNRLEDVQFLKEEIEDRYGPLDAELSFYMYEKLYKKMASKVGVQKTVQEANQVTLILSLEASDKIDGEKLLEKAGKFHVPIRLGYIRGSIHIIMATKHQKAHWLYLFVEFLDDLLYT